MDKAIKQAVQDGLIRRKYLCEKCGGKSLVGPFQPTRALSSVEWLCSKCRSHRRALLRIRAGEEL